MTLLRGKQIVLPKSQIQQGVRDYKRNQLRGETAQQASMPQAEVQPTEVAEPTQEPSMPTDEQGNVAYEEMSAEDAWDRLVAESGDDVDIATMVAQSNIEDAQKALDKAKKQTPKLVGTTEEKLATAKAFKESVVKAQNDLAKWQEIVDVPKRRASLQTESQGQQVADKLPASEEVTPKANDTENVENPTLLDVVRILYSKGKDVASKLFQRSFFDVAKTPYFMQVLGLRGEKFTIKYGVISRHFGKDGSHNLSERDWEQLPNALQNPFAIARLTDREDSYRIYTTLQTESGEYIVVGADVKNAGRDIEVNAISTAFGRRTDANLPQNEEVIYRSNEITPEQSSLLERPNFAQYPTEQELSTDKGSNFSVNNKGNSEKVEEEKAKKEAKYAEMDSDIETADNIVNADESEDDVMLRTSEEIEAEYPNWLEGTTTDSGKHSTQVEGTRKTYNKVGTWIENNLGKDVSILDASSGMGYGTLDLRERGFNIEDVEPYQSEERKQSNPATYSSYDAIGKEYDYIISNAVLNVIPDDWRANVLHDMAKHLKAGGKMFINTRKAGEEKHIKDKIELDSPQEVLVKRNGKIASYQRFFTPSELKAWVESELGDGYSVEVANEKNSGTKGLAAVVVTKNNEGLTNGKTSGLGLPISNHKGMENASMANVATKVGKNIEISKLLDTILPKIYQKGKLSGHEFLYELSKAFSQEQDKAEFNNSEYYDLDGNLQSAKRDEVNDRKPCRDIADYTKTRKCAKNSIKLTYIQKLSLTSQS